MTLLEQFENYLNNQLTNDLIEEDEREVPFNSYDEVGEESIFMTVKSGKDTYLFEYNLYFETAEGNCLYDFNFYDVK